MSQISRSSKLAFPVRAPVLATLSAAWLAATAGCMEPPPGSAMEPAAATGAPSPLHTLVMSGPNGLTTIDLTAQKPVGYMAIDAAVAGDGRTNNNPDGSIPCWGPYNLNATGSHRAVAAEFGYPNGDRGMLRARTTSDALGPWEKWDICIDDVAGTWSFGRARCQPHRVGGARLRRRTALRHAARSSSGDRPVERFIPGVAGFLYTFQSQANGLYVSAEFGYQGYDNGVLRARASIAKDWETFHFSTPPN